MKTARVASRRPSAACRRLTLLFDWIASKLGRHQTLMYYSVDTSITAIDWGSNPEAFGCVSETLYPDPLDSEIDMSLSLYYYYF